MGDATIPVWNVDYAHISIITELVPEPSEDNFT